MNKKIYFSRIGDMDSWVKNNDTGIFHIVLIPRRWWSIKDWKFAKDFQNNFRSGFITKETKSHE